MIRQIACYSNQQTFTVHSQKLNTLHPACYNYIHYVLINSQCIIFRSQSIDAALKHHTSLIRDITSFEFYCFTLSCPLIRFYKWFHTNYLVVNPSLNESHDHTYPWFNIKLSPVSAKVRNDFDFYLRVHLIKLLVNCKCIGEISLWNCYLCT